MKKAIVIIVILMVTAIAAIYLFFPATYKVETNMPVAARFLLVSRSLGVDTVWQVAAGNEGEATDQGLFFHHHYFKPVPTVDGQLAVGITGEGHGHDSRILVLELGKDSVLLNWSTTITGGNGPLARLQLLSRKNLLEADQVKLLLGFRNFLESRRAVYGLDIVPGFMTDSILLTQRFQTPDSPSVADVYSHIAALEQYAATNSAHATNAPMLFIQQLPNGIGYESQVGLPVDKELPSKGDIQVKRMVMGKNFTAEVMGPQEAIRKAFTALFTFMQDQTIMVPGIPFESLITNRLQEKDSTRWVTKIYMPSME